MSSSPTHSTENSKLSDVKQDPYALAASISGLRTMFEQYASDQKRLIGELKVEVARCRESCVGAHKRVDDFSQLWASQRGAMDQAQRDAGQMLKEACSTARATKERAEALSEMIGAIPDPEKTMRPFRVEFAQMKQDLAAIERGVDVRFQELPKLFGLSTARKLEARGEGPSAFTKADKQK